MSTSTRQGKRITVVTAGHLSACPRMLKAADALVCAGYVVRVVSVNHTPWAAEADAVLKRTRRWASSVVDYSAATGRALQIATGARFRAMRKLAAVAGPSDVPAAIAIRAYSRAHDEIVREVTREPTDFVYGGSTGALAAVAESAGRLGVPYGIDFEDLHSGEHDGSGGELANALAARIERDVIPGAALLTAGSPMIADAYAERYGVRPMPIHNTFTIVPGKKTDQNRGPLRLYWFSQTLGPRRGLDDVICAAGKAGMPMELHLRAHAIPEYLDALRIRKSSVAPQLDLVLHDPLVPDEMVEAARPYDAGLACEEMEPLNRRLCLTNKIFTYLAAGVPVIMTRTTAQARLSQDLGDAAFAYSCGDVDALARVLRELAANVELRGRSRAAARAAAERRWHWEHPEDRGALLDAVGRVF